MLDHVAATVTKLEIINDQELPYKQIKTNFFFTKMQNILRTPGRRVQFQGI